MKWDSIQQFVRIAAQWASGALVSKGLIAGSMEEMVIGAIVSAAALVWWFVWEAKRENPVPPTV